MASGAPVIAYGKGGILDTVNCFTSYEHKKFSNGILFKNQSTQDIIHVIEWFEDKKIWKKFNPEMLNNYSQKFSIENFITKFEFSINNSWDKFKKNYDYQKK